MASKTYQIAGCDVSFPRQPYGVQLAFMAKLIKSMESGENALLEAPTGCGKTLAILCAALAWQTKMKSARHVDDVAAEDFKNISKLKGSQDTNDFAGPSQVLPQDPDHMEPGQMPKDAEGNSEPSQVYAPKVYYCTRTHSQIAQVVQELKRAGYKPEMAYLGAKRHYCIHPQVSKAETMSVDEGCDELLGKAEPAKASRSEGRARRDSASGCQYFRGYPQVMDFAKATLRVHDIEDLSSFGYRHRACPYFVSRKLAETAELVFCPYNYIIDPGIREATGIDIGGAVIIFDEGHNIEDVAREAGSIDVTKEELDDALQDTIRPLELENGNQGMFFQVQGALNKLHAWLVGTCGNAQVVRQVEPLRFQCVWDGSEIHDTLASAGLDRGTVMHLQAVAKELEDNLKREKPAETILPFQSSQDEPEKQDRSGIRAVILLKRLTAILAIMYDASALDQIGPSAASSFRLVVTRWKERSKGPTRRYRRTQGESDNFHMEFSLWCLDPACIFHEIGRSSRSVIVTSGTLSPMTSFESELGIPFNAVLEGAHVVPSRQVLAMSISRCPQNRMLKATYTESNTAAFQDGVGAALLNIARAVPDGMLVFLPSYTMMDKLCARWRVSGLWNVLKDVKPLWTEPRDSGDLEKTIHEYYASIKKQSGGMYIAVCRGKVSEGINFADANARAVVLLGIPYPAFKDCKVVEKKKFNSHPVNRLRGLISGEQWYSLQAFRAMNQALGRCIRHKGDFGAIILLDERLRSRSIKGNLSRWLRDQIHDTHSIKVACEMLSVFFEAQLEKNGKKEPCPVSHEAKPEMKAEDMKLEHKVELKHEEASLHADHRGYAQDEMSSHQRWADHPKVKQLKISQVFGLQPRIKTEKDVDGARIKTEKDVDGAAPAKCISDNYPAPWQVETCDIKIENISQPAQPGCATAVCPIAAPEVEFGEDPPAFLAATQPIESLGLDAQKQQTVFTGALKLLELNTIGGASPCGTNLRSANKKSQDAGAFANCDGAVTDTVRSSGDQSHVNDADIRSLVGASPVPACLRHTAAGNDTDSGTAAELSGIKGTLSRLSPADAEFLETGLAAFLEDVANQDAQEASTTAVMHPCDPVRQHASSGMPTQPYGAPPEPTGQGLDYAQGHRRGGAGILRSSAGPQVWHAPELSAASARCHMGSCCNSYSNLPEGHTPPTQCWHTGVQGVTGVGSDASSYPAHQPCQSFLDSACAQWFRIDHATVWRLMSQSGPNCSATIAFDSSFRHMVSTSLLQSLSEAQYFHRQGQLRQYLYESTFIPCGLAVVLKFAHMEPGLPKCQLDEVVLLDRFMQAWSTDGNASEARVVLSQWQVGAAMIKLRHSYAKCAQY